MLFPECRKTRFILSTFHLRKEFLYDRNHDLYISLSAADHTPRADELPAVLGISCAGAYTLMRSKGFPAIFIGKRMVVCRDKFIQWMDEQVSA